LPLEDRDPRQDYLSPIHLTNCKVKQKPPIVFLFGGPFDYSTENKKNTVRQVLLDQIYNHDKQLSECLVTPENFKDWLNDGIYPDLLSFESDLAQTASLVVIALESPGSIAELGCFSVNNNLKNKLIVVLSEKHFNKTSFIKLGLLRQLPEENILPYPYNHKSVGTTLDTYVSDIVKEMKVFIDSIDKTTSFKLENNGHVALLIYELTLLFKALRFNEIKTYVSILGVNIKDNALKRLLFLLDKLDLVISRKRGKHWYYLPNKKTNRITLSGHKGEAFDRNEALTGISIYYSSSPNERIRKELIDEHNGGAA